MNKYIWYVSKYAVQICIFKKLWLCHIRLEDVCYLFWCISWHLVSPKDPHASPTQCNLTCCKQGMQAHPSLSALPKAYWYYRSFYENTCITTLRLTLQTKVATMWRCGPRVFYWRVTLTRATSGRHRGLLQATSRWTHAAKELKYKIPFVCFCNDAIFSSTDTNKFWIRTWCAQAGVYIVKFTSNLAHKVKVNLSLQTAMEDFMTDRDVQKVGFL